MELHPLIKPTRVQLDHIGFRTLQSRVPGFWPGRGWVRAPEGTPGGPCPHHVGDGVCVATTAAGAASGGHSLAGGVLIVGWRNDDVLGLEPGKVRVRAAYVLGTLTLRDWLTDASVQSDLSEADLTGADLSEASLTGADLTRADLTGANLTRASLTGADLTGADLTGADLTGADLRGANLTGADLTGASNVPTKP